MTGSGAELQSAKKHTKIDSRTTLELFSVKSCSKKHPIFKKWHAEEGHSLSSRILDRTIVFSWSDLLFLMF